MRPTGQEMSNANLHFTSLRIGREQHSRLTLLAKERRVSMAEIVRESIDAYLSVNGAHLHQLEPEDKAA